MPGPIRDQAGLGRVAAIVAVCCWSTGNVIVAGFDLPGLQTGFWRLVLGAAVYWAILHASGRRITWAVLRRVLPVAVTFSLELGVFFVALQHTTVANATTIGALQPIVLMAVASRRYRERIGRWLVGVALLAIGGVALVMYGAGGEVRPEGHLTGDLLAVVAMFLFSAYFIFVKDVRQQIDTFTLQAASMAIGSVVLLPLAAVEAGQIVPPFPSWSQWGVLALLLVIPGTGHFLMNWAHLHISLTLAGLLTLAAPVLSTVGAWLVLEQQLAISQVVGMAVVLGVLVLVVRRDARLHAEPD